MRGTPRLSIVLAAAALAAATAGPAAATDPPDFSKAYVEVTVVVEGFTVGDYTGFGGQFNCTNTPEPRGFGIGSANVPPSAVIELPAGETCRLTQFSGGDPGYLGEWGDWSADPGMVPTEAGKVIPIEVTIQRWYNGRQPEWDNGTWFPMEVFTVDRVYLNRYGGVTAEGTAWCPSLAASPVGPEPYIGINWDATQYVGRKTAIHGSYRSDIANTCFDPKNEETPVKWTSMHPAEADTGAATAWVYGENGRFGSGTIRIDADSYNEMELVSQWWDKLGDGYSDLCSPDDVDINGEDKDRWYDSNGDGFCAFYVQSGQRTTANLKTIAIKAK
jgi:hypothetical protein